MEDGDCLDGEPVMGFPRARFPLRSAECAEADGVETRVFALDGGANLEIRLEVEYDALFGALTWTVWFANPGAADSAVISDLDGTLYCQRPVRVKMALRLAGYYLLRLWRVRELAGIFFFRRIREEERFRTEDFSASSLRSLRKRSITLPHLSITCSSHWP